MGLLSLIAKLGLDITNYERNMAKAEHLAKDTAKEISSSVKSTLAGFFGVAAAEEAIRRTIEYTTRVKDLSEQWRMTTDQVQRLDAASKKVGLTFEDWERVIGKGIDPFAPGAEDKLDEAGPRAYKLKAALEELHNLGPIPLISKEDIEAIDKADKIMSRWGSSIRASISKDVANAAHTTNPSNPAEFAYGVAGLASRLPLFPGSKQAFKSLQQLIQKGIKGAVPSDAAFDPEVNPINGIPYDERYATDPEGISKAVRRHQANIQGPNLLTDDLARIGGFSGGTDRGVSSLLQQQLAVQRNIERNTKEEVDA